MRESFLVFGAPLIGEEEIAEVEAVLRSGWIGTGPRVARFEAAFAAYKGMPLAAAVNSCTAALHLAILGAGIGPGDEIITTPLTFCATVNAIIHSGATPVLADVDPATMNIDPARLAEKITPRTRAILPVHFAGRPCDMDPIMALAGERDLMVIEDCAHAIEATYKGRQCGSFGDFGCFSFYVTKNLITGEGGMVLGADEQAMARIRTLALHGMSADAWKRFSDAGYKHYFVVEPGFKYNMMDIQAALGLHQLERVEANHAVREARWAFYDRELAGLPLTPPAKPQPDTRHARHLYTILVNDDAGLSRDDLLAEMTARRIGVGVHYMSLPEHPYYQQALGWSPDQWPAARDVGRRTLSLPLSARTTEDDLADVVAALRDILKEGRRLA